MEDVMAAAGDGFCLFAHRRVDFGQLTAVHLDSPVGIPLWNQLLCVEIVEPILAAEPQKRASRFNMKGNELSP